MGRVRDRREHLTAQVLRDSRVGVVVWPQAAQQLEHVDLRVRKRLGHDRGDGRKGVRSQRRKREERGEKGESGAHARRQECRSRVAPVVRIRFSTSWCPDIVRRPLGRRGRWATLRPVPIVREGLSGGARRDVPDPAGHFADHAGRRWRFEIGRAHGSAVPGRWPRRALLGHGRGSCREGRAQVDKGRTSWGPGIWSGFESDAHCSYRRRIQAALPLEPLRRKG